MRVIEKFGKTKRYVDDGTNPEVPMSENKKMLERPLYLALGILRQSFCILVPFKHTRRVCLVPFSLQHNLHL